MPSTPVGERDERESREPGASSGIVIGCFHVSRTRIDSPPDHRRETPWDTTAPLYPRPGTATTLAATRNARTRTAKPIRHASGCRFDSGRPRWRGACVRPRGTPGSFVTSPAPTLRVPASGHPREHETEGREPGDPLASSPLGRKCRTSSGADDQPFVFGEAIDQPPHQHSARIVVVGPFAGS
jgi:hypothetical protein